MKAYCGDSVLHRHSIRNADGTPLERQTEYDHIEDESGINPMGYCSVTGDARSETRSRGHN